MRLKSGWNRDDYALMVIIVFSEIKRPITSESLMMMIQSLIMMIQSLTLHRRVLDHRMAFFKAWNLQLFSYFPGYQKQTATQFKRHTNISYAQVGRWGVQKTDPTLNIKFQKSFTNFWELWQILRHYNIISGTDIFIRQKYFHWINWTTHALWLPRSGHRIV